MALLGLLRRFGKWQIESNIKDLRPYLRKEVKMSKIIKSISIVLLVMLLVLVASYVREITGYATADAYCDWAWWPGNGQKIVINGEKYQCPPNAQYCKANTKQCCKYLEGTGHYDCVNPPGYNQVCTPGNKRCNNEKHIIEVCNNNAWERYVFCPYNCVMENNAPRCRTSTEADGADPWPDPESTPEMGGGVEIQEIPDTDPDPITSDSEEETSGITTLCHDPDGFNENTKTTVTLYNENDQVVNSKTDECSETTVVEYFCQTMSEGPISTYYKNCGDGKACSDGACKQANCKPTPCPNGYVCYVDGVCRKNSKTCTDSDNVDYYKKGITIDTKSSWEGYQWIDYCDGNQLVEFYCKSNDNVELQKIDCEHGCENGACKEESTQFYDIAECVWTWPQKVRYRGAEYSCGWIGWTWTYRPWCNAEKVKEGIAECCKSHSPYTNCVNVA